jgi:hypothetical protein
VPLLVFGIGVCLSGVSAEPFYEINGYYLGATPEELGVTIESGLTFEKKYYEFQGKGVRLFFFRHKDNLRSYRIIGEIAGRQDQEIKSIIAKLKEKYGTPKRQNIKTTTIRRKPAMNIETSVKNRIVWIISESQEFFAEVENRRIVLELIDHNPENIKTIDRPDSLSNEGFMLDEGWDPDY